MRRSLVFAALLTSAAFAAQANEGVELSNKVRKLAAAPAIKQADAPFSSARDPMPEILMREEQERRLPKGACEHNATALCYDLADRRVVYRPARKLMPQFDGLRAESVSLRHDKIVLKYSFR